MRRTDAKGRTTEPGLYGDKVADSLRRCSAWLATLLRRLEASPGDSDGRVRRWSVLIESELGDLGLVREDQEAAYRDIVTGGLYEWAVAAVAVAGGVEELLDRINPLACLLDRPGSLMPPIGADQVSDMVQRWSSSRSAHPITSRVIRELSQDTSGRSVIADVPVTGNLREARTEPPAYLRARAKGSTYAYRSGRDQRTNPRPNTIETPPGIARFLRDLIVAEYDVRRILDPCAGRGKLTEPWVGCEMTSFEINDGKDFFEHTERADCDLVLANPPFNNRPVGGKRFLPADFLSHILAMVSSVTPIALISPMGMRLNQRWESRRWRWMRDQVPAITGIVSLPIDTFEGVEFHTEVLFFNMGRLKPHYFVPDEYFDDKDEDRRDRTSPGGIDGDRG